MKLVCWSIDGARHVILLLISIKGLTGNSDFEGVRALDVADKPHG